MLARYQVQRKTPRLRRRVSAKALRQEYSFETAELCDAQIYLLKSVCSKNRTIIRNTLLDYMNSFRDHLHRVLINHTWSQSGCRHSHPMACHKIESHPSRTTNGTFVRFKRNPPVLHAVLVSALNPIILILTTPFIKYQWLFILRKCSDDFIRSPG